jgi:predicted amidohydrolase YtcJ
VKKGWSFAVHAIGDAAVSFALDSLNGLPAPGGPHRVEHVQHVDPVLIAHPAWEKLIPSIQPHHRTEDLGMLVDRVGRERAAHAFPARSLWRENRPLALGTDWPVISADPLHTIRSALLQRGDGEGMSGEELTLAQAVDGVTRGAAKAAGFAGVGEIAVGAEADLVLLHSNPLEEGWHETEVTAVWRAGRQIKN